MHDSAKAGGSVMAKDDSLKKPKKIEVNRIMILYHRY